MNAFGTALKVPKSQVTYSYCGRMKPQSFSYHPPYQDRTSTKNDSKSTCGVLYLLGACLGL